MENYDNAIFQYNKSIIFLRGGITLTGSQINQYTASDDPSYVDWTTLKLKIGDSVYYNKQNVGDTGLPKRGSHTATEIGVINSAVAATRVTVAATISDAVLADFEGKISKNAYVSRNLQNFSRGLCYYSYPLDKYIGIVSYDDSTLSLFFERTDRLIDEIRVSIKKFSHKIAIMEINKAFKFSNNKDIFFGQYDSLVVGSSVYGVKKVISTVPMNRN